MILTTVHFANKYTYPLATKGSGSSGLQIVNKTQTSQSSFSQIRLVNLFTSMYTAAFEGILYTAALEGIRCYLWGLASNTVEQSRPTPVGMCIFGSGVYIWVCVCIVYIDLGVCIDLSKGTVPYFRARTQ